MGEERNVYIEPETRMLLRTEDVYQTQQDSPVEEYSDTVLSIVANYRNGGRPEGWNTQSMVGKSKKGEVALRLFADIDPETRTFRKVGFKTRGCLAMTACASVICDMVEGKTFEEALAITPQEVEAAVDGVPWDKSHTPLFAVEAVKALVGHWLIEHGRTLAQLDAELPCDADSIECIMCEHCSLRDGRVELRLAEIMGEAPSDAHPAPSGDRQAQSVGASVGEAVHTMTPAAAVPLSDDEDAAVTAAASADDVEEIPEGSADVEPEDALEADDPEHEEARRAAIVHNALANVFDDVRVASADGDLVTPERWAAMGIVPNFMTVEDLEMAVYDYLSDWQKEHGRPEEEAGVTFLSDDPLASQRVEKPKAAGPSPFASRSVGVPAPIVVHPHGEAAGTEEEADTAPVESMPASDASDASAVAPAYDNEHDAASSQAPEIHSALKPGDAEDGEETSFDPDNPFAGLRIPDGYKLVELEGEWTLVELDPDKIPEEREIRCDDIVILMGAHGYYLYDRTEMTDTFAHWTFLAAEDDPLVTFVYCVREDSRIYPRPLARASLTNPPFSMTVEQIESAYEQARGSDDYADIGRIEASNKAVYFYSSDHLSPRQAEALAEWDAVGRPMSV